MTRKKGEATDMDLYEQSIRENADTYAVITFKPGSGMKTARVFNNDQLKHAIEYSKVLMQEKTFRIRAAMIYAIDEYNHHALVGTVNEFDPTTFKEAKIKYK